MSEEPKRKLSIIAKARYQKNPLLKKNLRGGGWNKGKGHIYGNNKGPYTQETKDKISESLKRYYAERRDV